MPTTPDIANLQANIDEGEREDPSIKYNYARRKQAVGNSLANPFGANVAPETLEAMKYAREADIDTEQGQAVQNDTFRRKEARFQKLYAKAGLTRPQLTQTGGSMTGTVSQPIWPGLLQGGIQGGLGLAAGAGL